MPSGSFVLMLSIALDFVPSNTCVTFRFFFTLHTNLKLNYFLYSLLRSPLQFQLRHVRVLIANFSFLSFNFFRHSKSFSFCTFVVFRQFKIIKTCKLWTYQG